MSSNKKSATASGAKKQATTKGKKIAAAAAPPTVAAAPPTAAAPTGSATITSRTNPSTAGAKEIILTTPQMAFFLFNLFGHDIIHDAHPALNSGSERMTVVLSESDIQKLNTVSDPHKGGGNKDDDFLGLTQIVQDETLKKNAIKSVKNIVESIGQTLMERKMLYAVEYQKLKKENKLNTLKFKDFQEKTFIIIDIERIISNYDDKNDLTYPGDIFYKGKKNNFWNITVNKNKNDFTVIWNQDETNYTVMFNSDKTATNDRIQLLQIKENNDTSNILSFFILCTDTDTETYKVCSKFTAYVNSLGDNFFYDTFVTFMENETYNSIDGILSMFPDYILNGKSRSDSDNTTNFNKYIMNFNTFIIGFHSYNDDNDVNKLFHSYNEFYKNFLDIIKTFYLQTKDLIIKKYLYVSSEDSYDELHLPDNINEITTNSIYENKDNKKRNKYITILAKIFAGYFNKQYSSSEKTSMKKVFTIIKSILKLNSCDQNFIYVQNFLRMTSLYFELKIINPELIEEQSAGKRYKQSGGDIIQYTMSIDQNLFLEDKNNTPKQKFENIMTGVPNPYNGKIETVKITSYLNNMKTLTNNIFENILDLIMVNLVSYITNDDDKILLAVKNSDNGWLFLFNIPDLPGTNKYLKGINDLILIPGQNLNSIVKMPATGKMKITPLFKFDCETLEKIDGNDTLKTLPDKSKQVMVELYNFEQAFIVQLKVFLLYNYTKLNFQKNSPQPTLPSDSKKTTFFDNFKTNFIKYYSIFQIVVGAKIDSFSQIQKVNTGYMISSSIGVISYCIKQIPATDINRIPDSALDNEMEILESIYLTKNLQKGSSVGDPDDKLIKHFKKMLSLNLLSYNGNYTISNSNNITNSNAKIMKHITPPVTNTNKLYLINNAINSTGMPEFFCPFSSILDGQSTCKTYDSAIDKGNPIEDGTLNVVVHNGYNIQSGSITTNNIETMRYHVRVTKGKWESNQKILLISAYLKIQNIVLINIGFGDVSTYSHSSENDKKPGSAISFDITQTESPFDAKKCISEIIDNNIDLTTKSDDTIRSWNDFLKIINENGSLVETKKYGNISRDLFRRKIIETSFKKSLGDYLQEINTVADNGGYTNVPTSIDANGNSVNIPPNNFRLGLSNDRPSGVRIASLILFGLSGINPNSMGGYYTIAPSKQGYNGSFMIASRKSSLLKNPAQIIAGGSKKRRKNLTKKRKKLFKNKKMSKRNNKGTRKRK